MDVKSKIKQLPLTSGVYLMKNARGKILYVGKALSLRKRVQSYFRATKTFSKTDLLVKEIRDIECIETHSEAGALILEASLIKRYRPKYNIELRDDKSYPFIEITGEKFPRIAVVRPRKKNPRSVYFGPYVGASLVREALHIIRRIFPFRTCDPFPPKACLDYDIGLCDAPCTGNISRRDYRRNIRHVRLILEGKKDRLLKDLKREMQQLSRAQRFEAAGVIRDQLQALSALYSGTPDINFYKEAEQLKQLLHLPRAPERIEAFDISTMMGEHSVGSMVSFFNGKPDKRNYRRFRIKQVAGIDDFQMIAEVVGRRYRRLKEEGAAFPDLIVIDGGKGQLSAASTALAALDVNIPLMALAKRQEEIFLPKKRGPVILPSSSLGLRLLQRVRDEAHRFAVSYHRHLRTKNVFL